MVGLHLSERLLHLAEDPNRVGNQIERTIAFLRRDQFSLTQEEASAPAPVAQSSRPVARSQVVLNYAVLAPLCDPILNRVLIYRATHQVAALHEAIEGCADIQFANIAPAFTGSS